MKTYSFSAFKKDLSAGLTVSVLAYPLAIAISIAVGISPQQGIFATIIGGCLASIFGGSKVLISGPTSTLITALFAIMSKYGPEGLISISMLSGILLIGFGLLGLGNFIKYMPYPVVTGLSTGIAVILFSSQIKDFLGLQMGDIVPSEFIPKWKAYIDYIWTWDIRSLITGLATLLIMIICKKVRPKWPAVMISLVIVTLCVYIFNIDIPTIGSKYTIAPGIPKFHFPRTSFSTLLSLMPEALTIAVLIGIESLLTAVISDGMTGGHHKSNCQLLSQGIANIGVSLFGGIPVTSSMSRTATNVKSGATTPIAGISHAFFLLLILLVLAPLSSKIPLTCLAAVLIMVAWSMSEIHHFFHLLTAPKRDVLVLISVFFLTVLIDITSAVQIGMMLAAFLFMKQMSDVSDVVSSTSFIDDEKIAIKDDHIPINRKEIPDEIEIYEINGPFFFGVADRLKNIFNTIASSPKIFILRMSRVPTIDASAMHALEEFFKECDKQGTTLLLVGVKKTPLSDLQRYNLDSLIGKDHIFKTIHPAIEFAKALLSFETSNHSH